VDPNSVDLESADDLYMKLRDRSKLTPGEIKQLIKTVDEVKFIINTAKLGPQGQKSAVSIYNKLLKLESKHRLKKEIQITKGLFNNT